MTTTAKQSISLNLSFNDVTSSQTAKKLILQTEEDEYEKFSFFPIKHHNLLQLYKRQTSLFWMVDEIDFSADRHDWDNLNPNIQTFLKFLLCFFAQADGLITSNIDNFKRDSVFKEASYFYAAQELIEVIHNETYSTSIEVFITDEEEKKQAFNAIKYYPSIGKIAMWMKKWMDPSIPMTERVLAFAFIEGVMFSSAFAGIYWIKKQNVLPGLCKSNEFIARDEALHTEFAAELYDTLVTHTTHTRLSDERISEILMEGMAVAENFVRNALKVDLIGLKADDMVDYVKCCTNNLANSFGSKNVYSRIENPFLWMATIALPNKSNFHETRPSEYAKISNSDLCDKDFDDSDEDF